VLLIQLLDYPHGQIGGIADINEGGKLGAALSSDLEYMVEPLLPCDLVNHCSDVIEKLTGDHDHAFVEDLKFSGTILLMFTFERGILMMFDEETLVILLTLFFLAAGILYSTLEISEFYLKELKGFRTRIPEQCFAGLLHSISLCVSEMVRLKCLCHVNGCDAGPGSLEG